MRLWRISSDRPGVYGAADLTGEGARREGARWNPKGIPAVYASFHLATALLETLVHLGGRRQPSNRHVVAIDVDDAQFNDRRAGMIELGPQDLPLGWNEMPPGPASQVAVARQFELGRLGVAVPSVILPEELNIVMNPLHPAFKAGVSARIIRPFKLDLRL